jgi:hypothetical protein
MSAGSAACTESRSTRSAKPGVVPHTVYFEVGRCAVLAASVVAPALFVMAGHRRELRGSPPRIWRGDEDAMPFGEIAALSTAGVGPWRMSSGFATAD